MTKKVFDDDVGAAPAPPSAEDGQGEYKIEASEPKITPPEPMGEFEKELINQAALLDMSAPEIEAIRDKARKRANAKQREAVEKRLEELYYQQAVAAVDPDEELVEFVPDFPISNQIHNRVNICGAVFNNKPFENGRVYRIPISQFRDLAYISFMAKKNEHGLRLRDRDGIPPLNINLPRTV